MTNESDRSMRRNRRFLISIWERTGAPRGSVDGLIWEADPKLPGRIAEPTEFQALSDLPGIVGGYLGKEGGDA